MSPGVAYGARQQDLYYPAKTLDSFPAKRPTSDAELCAWMALLAYCDDHLGDTLYIARNRKVIPNPSEEYVSRDRFRARLYYLFRYAWRRAPSASAGSPIMLRSTM
jgi:hypothetical protein